jgi:hypothetical protein
MLRWRLTLAALVLVLLAALVVLLRDRSDDAVLTERLAAGYLYPRSLDELRWFELVYPEKTLRVERERAGAAWRLTAPVADLGDTVVIDRLLATLAGQKVERWLPPASPAEQAGFGLTAPRLTLRLGRAQGVDTLRFGDLNPVEKRLWVAVSWRDSLALVSTLLRTHALKGRYELADKRPLGALPPGEVERIEIENARGRFALARGEKGWELRRPEAYPADQAAVNRLFERLWGESILGFAGAEEDDGGALGFAAPRAKVAIALRGSTRSGLLEIGRPHFELSYARNRDRDHAFLLDSVTCAPLLESFSAFLSPVLLSFMPGELRSISGPGGRRALREAGDAWRWTSGEGEALDGPAVAGLLGRLLRLSTERVEALLPRDDQLADWGLTGEADRFTLAFRDGSELAFEVGPSRGGRRALRRLDYPTLYSLPDSLLALSWPLPPAAAPAAGAAERD